MAAQRNRFCFLDESYSDSVPEALACCSLILETEQSWTSHLKQSLSGMKGFQMENSLVKKIKINHITTGISKVNGVIENGICFL